MAGANYHIGFSNIGINVDAGWTIESADSFAEGALLVRSGDGIRLYLFPDHLRALREQITKALGESPQDDSELENFKHALSEARDNISICEDIVRNKFKTVDA